MGNRTLAVAGIPGNPDIYYAGAATGGIWKTEDGGIKWRPVFDDQDVHAIGALAVSESDPNIVWAGTGETFIRANVSIGIGVFKSTDAGETWKHMGLDETARIGRIAIHPTNPDIVYAASLGHAYTPQPERGIYRTMDGGETWEHVLFVDENTGASDLIMDPNNPRVLYAGMWHLELKTWTRVSGGPGSGIFMTRDGGDTWTKLEGNGLPELDVGKVALCMSKADSRRVYALIETADGVSLAGEATESGELWMTSDGAKTWTLQTHNRNLSGRNAYYARCAAAPDDPDETYFLTASYAVSLDAGKSHDLRRFEDAPGWDHHDMWIDPTDGDRQAVAHDGGVSISLNRGTSWYKIQLPIAQMYHVTVDNDIPYNVLGNRQDGPSTRGPSRAWVSGFIGGGLSRGMWHGVGGGESGFATPDPEDPNIVWSTASGAGAAGGIVTRYDERARQFRQLEVWPESTRGRPAEDLRYRFQWVFPLLISPHDRKHGLRGEPARAPDHQRGPELGRGQPRPDHQRQVPPDHLRRPHPGQHRGGVLLRRLRDRREPGDRRRDLGGGRKRRADPPDPGDGGANWTDVTANVPDMPVDGVVRNIDASKWDAGKAYMTVEAHQVGKLRALRVPDRGLRGVVDKDRERRGPTARSATPGNVREDPVRPGLLYLGTENFLYVSFDDGDNWQRLANGLPPSPMYWIAVQEHFGRPGGGGPTGAGFWIMDDISPLQQWTDEVADAAVHLFQPRGAYRFHPITPPFAHFDDWSEGEKPALRRPRSTFWLAEAGADVSIEIRNAGRERTIRTLETTGEKGLNRVTWDLREEASTQAVLRTKPLFADWVTLDEEAEPAPGRSGGSRSSPRRATTPWRYRAGGRQADRAHRDPEGPEERGHARGHRRPDRAAPPAARRPRDRGRDGERDRVAAASGARPEAAGRGDRAGRGHRLGGGRTRRLAARGGGAV